MPGGTVWVEKSVGRPAWVGPPPRRRSIVMGDDARWTNRQATHRNVGSGRPTAKTTLPAEASSAAAARRFVRDVLANRDLEGLAEPAALLTSELVANAVLFARSDVVVEVLFPSPCVRFEVRAREPGASRAHGARPNEAVPGRALDLVAAMADNWGTLADGEGKCVWFELRVR
jgi:anti-sigma regulatory factor (Ser/Thr protein kinase)